MLLLIFMITNVLEAQKKVSKIKTMPNSSPRNIIFILTDDHPYDFMGFVTPTIFGVRTDKYKYIRGWGIWDMNELYDLEKDPDEIHNLAQDKKYADIKKKLAGDLFD
ncbi:MAG: acetylglucosamine-6-sulfatase [Mucilaginibacter sp.]|nr:acetylglucosamine-6-sulfatase [Mucilaginibacter sp.]